MQKQKNLIFKHLNDCLLTNFKNTSQTLKQYANKSLYENHNKLMNRILLVTDKDISVIIDQILTHLLAIIQVKNCRDIVIIMLTKFIQFMKFYQKFNKDNDRNQPDKQNHKTQTKNNIKCAQILNNIVDIILLTQNKTKSSETDALLRIIQTTFSLIDYQFVQYMSYSLLTKIYSISFDCCSGGPVLQNISISCLFSLTETLFGNNRKIAEAHQILQNFLEYLFRAKRFSWIKNTQLNGMIWDLVTTAINNSNYEDLYNFVKKQSNYNLINLMYKIGAQKAFNSKFHSKNMNLNQNNKKEKHSQNSINFKHDEISEFIRCYKAFIILSIQFSLLPLQSCKNEEIVPFRDNTKLFNVIYDQQRNYKMYIILQGIFMLIDKYPKFAINQPTGYILFQVISKICEQLCLCNQKIDCSFTNQKSYLNKFYYGDLNNITDGDFMKIIKNSIVNLRKRFENIKIQQQSQSPRSDKLNQSICNQSLASQRSSAQQQNKDSNSKISLKKRWQKFIKCIIKIIRYLSSISILSETDQQPVRKIILQLQHWFLICPIPKIRNMILQQLLITTSTLKSKPQAIKISQCIQIGSNLFYGYYDMLDSVGLTIIMKMMASIKAERQDGKQYQQLQEVFNMSQKLYLEQKIVKTLKNFQMTIQAFVQCSNSLLADLQQPVSSANLKRNAPGKNPSQRYYKMIEYLLQKLNIVILQNKQFIFNDWNFLTGFWMSFCSSKNQEVQLKTIFSVGQVVHKLLQSFIQKQQQIISIYLELAAKCSIKNDFKIQMEIMDHVKNYIPLMENQQALMQTFKMIKILQTQVKGNQLIKSSFQSQNNSLQKKFILELSELQQTFIKEGIFRIKKMNYLANILKGIQVLGNQKNQQYKIFTLLWNFADHLRNMLVHYKKVNVNLQEYEDLWKQVFYKLAYISGFSLNAETKQSAIHTFTQIIAQNSIVINQNLLNELYKKVFIDKLFVNLFDGHSDLSNIKQNHHSEISLKVQMIKTAIKNFIKLTKKFILQNIFQQPICQYIELALQKILIILKQSVEKKQEVPVQILYQFLAFVQKVMNNQNFDNKYLNVDFLDKILHELEELGRKANQTTILWKKKYIPHYQQVKSTFNKIINQKEQKNTQIKLQNGIDKFKQQINDFQQEIQTEIANDIQQNTPIQNQNQNLVIELLNKKEETNQQKIQNLQIVQKQILSNQQQTIQNQTKNTQNQQQSN